MGWYVTQNKTNSSKIEKVKLIPNLHLITNMFEHYVEMPNVIHFFQLYFFNKSKSVSYLKGWLKSVRPLVSENIVVFKWRRMQ